MTCLRVLNDLIAGPKWLVYWCQMTCFQTHFFGRKASKRDRKASKGIERDRKASKGISNSENLCNFAPSIEGLEILIELTLKRGIFWIQSDQCGHSEWNIAIGSAGEYLSRNRLERAESFSDRPQKGKYRSLKCWNLEYYHPSEVHPHTSAICMHTIFKHPPCILPVLSCKTYVLTP